VSAVDTSDSISLSALLRRERFYWDAYVRRHQLLRRSPRRDNSGYDLRGFGEEAAWFSQGSKERLKKLGRGHAADRECWIGQRRQPMCREDYIPSAVAKSP